MTTLDSYDTANQNTSLLLGVYPLNDSVYYQSWTTLDDGKNYRLTEISNIMLGVQEGRTCTCVCEVYAHDGTYGTSSVPTGVALATSDELDETDISDEGIAPVTFSFTGAEQIILSPNTHYVWAVKCTAATGQVAIGADNSSPTHGGNSGSWTSS